MMMGIRVAVIDDHPLFREGVSRSLSEIDGFEIVAEGGSRDEAIAIARSHNPDVMLIDISMPGGGLNAIPAILTVAPSQKIVMLTVSEANDDVAAALKEGAKGYILKGIGARALADVIRTVASGESYVAPTLSAKLLTGQLLNPAPAKSNLVAELTRREQE
ncbi:DNA-binding response regulator, partial [Sinorhizobium medicae]